jgi:hypothetical protein
MAVFSGKVTFKVKFNNLGVPASMNHQLSYIKLVQGRFIHQHFGLQLDIKMVLM